MKPQPQTLPEALFGGTLAIDDLHLFVITVIAVAMTDFGQIEFAEPGIDPAIVFPDPFALAALANHF